LPEWQEWMILSANDGTNMNPIKRDELFEHVSGFLKSKGIELKDGSYANGIQKGCGLLVDAINLSQKGLSRAKVEIDKKLDQMRQVVHEKTAPKPKAEGVKTKPQPQKPKKKSPKRANVNR
jgi:hypothetical protein